MNSKLPDHEALEDSWARSQEPKDEAFEEAYHAAREEILCDADNFADWLYNQCIYKPVRPHQVTSYALPTDLILGQPTHVLVALMVSEPGPRAEVARQELRDRYLTDMDNHIRALAAERI